MSHVIYRIELQGLARVVVIRHDVVIGHIDVDRRAARFVFLANELNRISCDLAEKTLDDLKRKIEAAFPSLG